MVMHTLFSFSEIRDNLLALHLKITEMGEGEMRMSRRVFKSLIRIVIGIIALILYTSSAVSVSAETATAASDDTSRDFVLVLDCSGSMNRNDKEGLTKIAAEKFIDLLPAEHKTRVSIVTFGPNYGSEAYSIYIPEGKEESFSDKRIKLAYDLQELTNDKKESVKKILDKEIKQSGEYSPIGYALETATTVLEKGEALSGADNTAIILLTDGQVEGQSDGYNNSMDYESLERAVSVAKSNGWPIYCMELNYNNENKQGSGLPGIAYYQMRENIPVKTGTEPFELKDASQAEDVFSKIFEKMYNIFVEVSEERINDGKATKSVTVKDMTAEQNITLQGNSKAVEKVIEIKLSGPGGVAYEFKPGDKISDDGNVYINFSNDKKYINVKMLAPLTGEWSVTAEVSDPKAAEGLTIEFKSISLMDTTLQLESDRASGEIASGEKITFIAKYVYNGTEYTSETFYKKHPAKLYVNDEAISMNASTESYSADYTFEKKGVYKVYVDIESDDFRTGHKKSGELSFTIDNEPIKADEANPIEDITIGAGKEAKPINLKEHFINGDGDKVSYKVNYDHTVFISHKLTGDNLVMTAGTRKGEYEVEVVASDGSSGEGAVQKFNLNVENQPIELVGASDVTINLEYDDPEKNSYPILYSDYFSDPDEIAPRMALLGDLGENIEIEESDTHKGITLIANGPCNANFEISAVDASDITQSQVIKVNVISEGGITKVLHKFGILIIILAVLLIILIISLIAVFVGRKIYGMWDITPDSGSGETDREIGKTGSGKKAVCSLNALLDELDIPGEFGRVRMVAGNNFNKIVYFENLKDMDTVEYDGLPVEDTGKKIAVKSGHSIRIVYDGRGITFDRLR